MKPRYVFDWRCGWWWLRNASQHPGLPLYLHP
jgi:hypothetical protein